MSPSILAPVPVALGQEASASLAAHAKPHSQDGLEAVMADLAYHLAFALDSNYPEFPDS